MKAKWRAIKNGEDQQLYNIETGAVLVEIFYISDDTFLLWYAENLRSDFRHLPRKFVGLENATRYAEQVAESILGAEVVRDQPPEHVDTVPYLP